MKMKRMWVHKKEPTNPVKKESHQERKVKKVILQELLWDEQQQQIKDFLSNEDQPLQE